MKNPFLLFEDFISPLQCEDIIIGNDNTFPNLDKHNKIQPLYSRNALAETRIMPQVKAEVVPTVESYYGVDVKGVTPFSMEWYVAGFEGSDKPRCENSSYINKQWKRSNNNDFTAVIFLNDYNAESPFDDEYEVFGGQLEFPTHGFGFNPQRGLLVIFPGAPNFLNSTAAISAGELTQIRFHIATHELFMYDMENFKGSFETWFK